MGRTQHAVRRLLGALVVLSVASLAVASAAAARPEPVARAAQAPPAATTSSPIAISRDGRLVWNVNPATDTVTVIRTSTNAVLATIPVGDEPESIALDPSGRNAYVANAAASTVSAIRVTSPNPSRFRARVVRTFTTGAEPWNVVVAPDGRRAYVANSSQDTVTVIDATRRRVIGDVNVGASVCNDPDRNRVFQPRGLAVTRNSRRLYVTGFLAFTRPGGRQGDDTGKQGIVCRIDVSSRSRNIGAYRAAARIAVAPEVTGFTVDANGDGTPDPTSAFPNQMQSIVIRGNQAYLPNIAASPDGPQRFNTTTMAFVNVLDGVLGGRQSDSAGKFINLHLGARDPEPGKKRLFFANPWAIAFTRQSGAGAAYTVSAGSDLLVKSNVGADGKLTNTVDQDTTRYIDLNDPANQATSGSNAGKNPQGIAITPDGRRAYVMNFVSRNVSVVDLTQDRVLGAIRTAPLPPPGSPQEVVLAGAEMFFSSRGTFNRPANAMVSTSERLSQDAWQSCSSCHFKGLTDGVVWEFASGPRKSIPLNATFNPANPQQQRILNYSAIFDEVDDFTINVRNVSGPGPLATPQPCSAPPPDTSTNDPAHGLLIGDNGDVNLAPCVINSFAKPNADRPQLTLTLPGSNTQVPALTALREWVRAAVRTPNPPLLRQGQGNLTPQLVQAGQALFAQAGCTTCHVGGLWSTSVKDFVSPPPAAEIATETNPPPAAGTNPVGAQFLNRFLRDIGSFNRGVPGGGNELGNNIGATEKAAAALVNGVAQPQQDALGRDYNNDGKGNGFSPPSVLGLNVLPPYYHNGACETLACVVDDVKHRTANGTLPDRLTDPQARAALVAFLRSIGRQTQPFGG